jgi:hypothetical protein
MKMKKFIPIVGITLTIVLTFALLYSTISDVDADGILDVFDNCPNVLNPTQADFDLDSQGNECDLDDDNDGIVDKIDTFKEDNQEWLDFDFDGIGSTADADDDNDGIPDKEDEEPIPIAEKMLIEYSSDIGECAIQNYDTTALVCYSNFFESLATDANNADTLELAAGLSRIGAIDDCHFVSHNIGHVAFEKIPDVITNLRQIDGAVCRGGFYHGVISSYFHNMKGIEKDFPPVNDICSDLQGTSNYQDCIHGIGHGLVHYYGEDLNSAVSACNQMSFYHNVLCIKGVMMQYTDNEITRNGKSSENLSNLCQKDDLNQLDYQQCAMSIGSTLAFHSNHNFDESSKYCELITYKEDRKYCLEGLRLEIQDSQEYQQSPLNQDIREKFQPMKIDDEQIVVDIRSPATISNFIYFKEMKFMQFNFDRSQYIIIYVPNALLPSNPLIAVNGQIPNDLFVDKTTLDGYTVIRILPKQAGIVMISGT